VWFWDGQEHVDPSKEAAAQQKWLESCTTNLAIEYANQFDSAVTQSSVKQY
jgi:hypothetical protein